MNVLAMEGYYSGSHKAFLDGWMDRSDFQWTLLKLPGYKWKWRMRHGAITFADEVKKRIAAGEKWDVIFCTDMLNLAEFLGLVPQVRDLKSVVYFHENQLTYPVRFESERDYQFVMTNMTTALAADEVWFNSTFGKDEFIDGLAEFLKRMPDYQPLKSVEDIRSKSKVWPQGVGDIQVANERKNDGILRIVWAARWEHDKNPEDFFAALRAVKERGVKFEVSVIGEQFRDMPEVFSWAKRYFADEIHRWGYQPGRREYEKVLSWADVFVSTANHEFFGISAVEAILAGEYPVLPERLAYPEVLQLDKNPERREFFYDGSAEALTEKLCLLAKKKSEGDLFGGDNRRAIGIVERLRWDKLAPKLDNALKEAGGESLVE